VTPHVAQNESGRRSAIDGRATSWGGYKVSQRLRKRVEEIFGWIKTVGGGRKLRFIGLARNQLWAEMTAAAAHSASGASSERRLSAQKRPTSQPSEKSQHKRRPGQATQGFKRRPKAPSSTPC
jgi:hypothetical protein